MELTKEIIEDLMKMMQTHKIDQLKVGELHLVKTKFDYPMTPPSATAANLASEIDNEELLFYSTSAPALSPEMVSALAANGNPPPVKRTKSKKDKS